jgi:hypothetical protein
MDVSTLLADPAALRLDAFVSNDNSITLRVDSVQHQSACQRAVHNQIVYTATMFGE